MSKTLAEVSTHGQARWTAAMSVTYRTTTSNLSDLNTVEIFEAKGAVS